MLLAAAGCGGEEQQERSGQPLAAALAASLAARSDLVAAKLERNDRCGALADAKALQRATIAAVNAGRVAPGYQEELGGSVSSLVASIGCAGGRGVRPSGPTQSSPPARAARRLAAWLRRSSG